MKTITLKNKWIKACLVLIFILSNKINAQDWHNWLKGTTHSELEINRFDGAKFFSMGQADLNAYNSTFDFHHHNGNDIRFLINSNEYLRINARGNVGIGTNNPQSKLDINQSSNTDWAAQIVNNGGSGKGLKIKASAGDSSTPILQTEDNYGNVKMVVQTNGNVGIGTNNPQSKLDINQSSNTDWAAQIVNNGGSGKGLKIKASAGDSSTPILQTEDNYGNVKMVVQTNGNVGIGTSSPQSLLHIRKGYQGMQFLTGTNTSGYTASIGVNDDGINFTNDSSIRGYNFSNASRNLFSIASNGNVGIGTTTPSNSQGWNTVLDVAGTSHAKILATSENATFKTGMYSHSSWYGGGGFLGTESNHNLHLMTGYSPKLSILTNGNVGIGTTNPVAKLTIQGNILASSIKVAVPGSANWSDYVFAKEYQLQPLEEVEAFIQKNQHLPNVPSAAEMVKEGNDLGKTDAKLLEKIEELTLYVIEMKKTINSLNNKIQELEKKPKTNNNLNLKQL